MGSVHNHATYRTLRSQPLWRLLASDLAPAALGLMQAHLYEAEDGMPGSLLHPRIERDLVDLRAQGVDMPLAAQHYVARWLSEGWVERRLPPGASEEIYELSSAAEAAIRFAAGLDQPRAVATESRLAIVIGAIGTLAEDADTDKAHDKAVTREGQVKQGSTRHEKDDRRRIDDRKDWVLGFSNRDKLELYRAQAAETGTKISTLQGEVDKIKAQGKSRNTRFAHWQFLANTR